MLYNELLKIQYTLCVLIHAKIAHSSEIRAQQVDTNILIIIYDSRLNMHKRTVCMRQAYKLERKLTARQLG